VRLTRKETEMIVREIMTPQPYAVEVTETVGDLMNKLAEADVRHLPVVDQGSLVGIVSDRDLRSIMASPLDTFNDPDETRRLLASPIARLMSSDVVSVNPETDVTDVIDLMIEHRIGAVPVVEPNSDSLIGIVSYVDLLRAARDTL
jgi:acetoin utilization protein AcuB